MSKQVNPLARIRNFCLQFPDSKEVIQFGHPFFKWRDKPFAVSGENDISIKVEKESQPLFLEDPRFMVIDPDDEVLEHRSSVPRGARGCGGSSYARVVRWPQQLRGRVDDSKRPAQRMRTRPSLAWL